jgi:hypothetical protein
METLRIKFFAASHAPSATEALVSDDGVNWTSAGKVAAGSDVSLPVNRNIRFLRVSMSGNPAVGYPVIRDIFWN